MKFIRIVFKSFDTTQHIEAKHIKHSRSCASCELAIHDDLFLSILIDGYFRYGIIGYLLHWLQGGVLLSSDLLAST